MGSFIFSIRLGRSIPSRPLAYRCIGVPDLDDILCLNFTHSATLFIYYTNFDDVECYEVNWILKNPDLTFIDGFYINNAYWYGIGEMLHQKWPTNLKYLNNTWLITGDLADDNDAILGNVLDSYLLSSNGVALYLLSEYLTYFTYDESDKTFNIHQRITADYNKNFSYVVCIADSITRVHKFMLSNYISKPTCVPKGFSFDEVVWSTYAKFKKSINDPKIYKFTQNIVHHNFSGGYILIQDGWEKFIGDWSYNTDLFPNIGKLVNIIKDNFKIVHTVYPYFDVRSTSEHIFFIVWNNYVIRDDSNHSGALILWRNNSVVFMLDPTNNKSVHWFVKRFNLLKYPNSSFLLSGTAIKHLKSGFVIQTFNDERIRVITKYTEMISKLDAVFAVTSAWRTQNFPFVIQISQRISSWNGSRGLQSIIPTVLTLGILGYPYILPNVIGGVSLDDLNETITKQDNDLYIRWFQLAICMPFIEISNAPWDYTDAVIEIAKHLMDIRELIILPKIWEVISETIDYGYPIIRPIWWIAPLDEIALTIDDEFLIGTKTLISPILKPINHRDIYLPRGKWHEAGIDTIHKGPTWLREYKISYYEIAFFTLIPDD